MMKLLLKLRTAPLLTARLLPLPQLTKQDAAPLTTTAATKATTTTATTTRRRLYQLSLDYNMLPKMPATLVKGCRVPFKGVYKDYYR